MPRIPRPNPTDAYESGYRDGAAAALAAAVRDLTARAAGHERTADRFAKEGALTAAETMRDRAAEVRAIAERMATILTPAGR